MCIYFSAISWCPPCSEYYPTYKKLEEEMQGKATLYQLDHDDYPESESKYKIHAYPSFVFYKDGHRITDSKGLIQGADWDLVKPRFEC